MFGKNKTEQLLESLVNQNKTLIEELKSSKQLSLNITKLLESGFNSANLLAMKESLDRIEQKVGEINELKAMIAELKTAIGSLNQNIQAMNSHITKLIDLVSPTSIIEQIRQNIPNVEQIKQAVKEAENELKQIEMNTRNLKHTTHEIERYLDKFKVGETFTATEITSILDLMPNSTTQFLNRLIKNGKIQKISKNAYKKL